MTEQALATGPYQLLPQMTEEQYKELKESIREYGVKVPIEYDADTGAILDGHHRFKIWCELIEEGADIPMYTRIDRKFASDRERFDHVITLNVNRRHLTPEQRRELAFKLRRDHGYTLQRLAQLLGVSTTTVFYDLKELSDAEREELKTIEVKGADGRIFTGGGYAERAIITTGDKALTRANSMIEGARETEQLETKAEFFQKKWEVQPGQLWVAASKSAPGEFHKLGCFDARESLAWGALFSAAEDKAQMLWTDPPYGVSYIGKTKDALTFENDRLDTVGLELLVKSVFMYVREYADEAAPFYLAHPPGQLQWVFGDVLRALGWRMHETLIWVKDSMVLGHSDYHLKHEPIYYGWLPGGEGRPGRGQQEGSKWYGDDSQVSVFEVPRPKRSEEHPTMKPTNLIAQHIQNSSPYKGKVLDPFAGSFSTAVAAEQVGRVCYGIELDPTNVAIGLDRLASMGLEPTLIG